jgi:translocator protein
MTVISVICKKKSGKEEGDMSGADILKIIAAIVICEGAGVIGAIFTTPAIPSWYKKLKKPGFTPPNSVFGPIWITLYLLMAVALFLVWREGFSHPEVTTAYIVFFVQLALNILWSVVFFGLKSLSGGLILIIILWVMILVNIILFFGISAAAGILLIPYIIWVSIASNLNLQVWRLNR